MKYNSQFVEFRPILTKEQKEALHEIERLYPRNFLVGARNLEEIEIDFVYTSAKIEGNSYDRLDTMTLIKNGLTAGSKKYTDALMIMNLRDAFADVTKLWDEPKSLTADYIKDIHYAISKGLLLPSQSGVIRQESVVIAGTEYNPLSSASQIASEFKFICETANKYTDAFERAIYLHCNLAYLQPFQDGNKRVARMMQTAALLNDQKFPILFNDQYIKSYFTGVIDYYETGDYHHYIEFVLKDYLKTAEKLNILTQEEPVTPDRGFSPEDLQNTINPNHPSITGLKDKILAFQCLNSHTSHGPGNKKSK